MRILLTLAASMTLAGCVAGFGSLGSLEVTKWDDEWDELGGRRGGVFYQPDGLYFEGLVTKAQAEAKAHCGPRKIRWDEPERVSGALRHSFYCEDPDKLTAFTYSLPPDGSPVCIPIDDGFEPNAKRLKEIGELEGSDDCVAQQGWLRFLTSDGLKKSHIFVGDKGKALCEQLEAKMVKDGVKSDGQNTFLRANLTCNVAH